VCSGRAAKEGVTGRKRSTQAARWDPFGCREARGAPDVSHSVFYLPEALSEGVLTIEVPRSEAAKPKQIAVE
jgi:hypothetical protein